MKINKLNNNGFTIVELMIALVILSFILLLSTEVIIGIGDLFDKGQSIAKTQNITDQVASNVINDIKFSSSISTYASIGHEQPAQCLNIQPEVCGIQYSSASGTISANVYVYCIGEYRYSFTIDREEIGSSSPLVVTQFNNNPTYHAVWLDKITNIQQCVPLNLLQQNPETQTTISGYTGVIQGASYQDLLLPSMRVLSFAITNNPEINFYNFALTLAYGDDDLLNISSVLPNGFYSGSCINSSGQRFCDVTQLNSGVSLR